MMRRASIMALLLGAAVAASAATRSAPIEQKSEPPPPEVLKRTGFDQNLGAQLPLDKLVRNEEGQLVPLGTYFTDRPVVFSLVYYNCPMLCNLVLNGMMDTLREVAFVPGRDYEIVTLSFNHEETHLLAAEKKANYIADFKREGAEAGWHFLTADEESVAAIAGTAGFKFAWDEKAQEYAHGSGIMVATPDGRLSHYFYGVMFSPRDVRLALVDSSDGKIGNPVDQLMLFCYHYNPVMGGYNAAIMNLVRAGCFATIGALGLFLMVSWRKERKAPPAAAAA